MPDGGIVEPDGSDADDPPSSTYELVTDTERLRERALFLRELAEARALLARDTLWRQRH